jgi:cytochrome c-type biogenesis protein CcmF
MIALGGALALVGRERRGWLMKWRAHNMTTEGVEA